MDWSIQGMSWKPEPPPKTPRTTSAASKKRKLTIKYADGTGRKEFLLSLSQEI
jgi:hypothetical protein